VSVISDSSINSTEGEDVANDVRTRRTSSGRRFVVGWLCVVALLLAAAGTFVVLAGRSSAETGRGREARSVAIDHVSKLLSYTPATVDSDLKAELPWLTGTFRTDYEKLVREKIEPAATKAKISVDAQVVGAAVARSAGDEVSVLVFINVDTSSSAVKTPRLTGSRVQDVMKQESGRWLISEFTPLQGAAFSLQ
jgi:Mce-associated membrane protein